MNFSWAVKRGWLRNQSPCTIYLDTSLKNWASFLGLRREGDQGRCVIVWYDTSESFRASPCIIYLPTRDSVIVYCITSLVSLSVVWKEYPFAFNNQPIKAGGSGACPWWGCTIWQRSSQQIGMKWGQMQYHYKIVRQESIGSMNCITLKESFWSAFLSSSLFPCTLQLIVVVWYAWRTPTTKGDSRRDGRGWWRGDIV